MLTSSSTFSAVDYNERKIRKGVAQLLEIRNFPLPVMAKPSPDEMRKYLIDYSAKNDRIKRAQFHVAISCKGREMTETQLLDFAHGWLKEMGYADEGQPLLIYAHRDTDNNHVHIITSRVNPLGQKIDHRFERVRSQRAINKILGIDADAKLRGAVEKALTYSFSSMTQFQAVLESMGYENYAYLDNGVPMLAVKRDGTVQLRLQSKEIKAKFKTTEPDAQRIRQLRAILRKYQSFAGSKDELQSELKTKFGMDLVFFGRKDSPYGYMLIDHHNRQVINGSKVMKIKDLMNFEPSEDRFMRIDQAIHQMLTSAPDTNSRDLNRMLRRQFGASLSRGTLTFNGCSIDLPSSYLDIIKENDRIEWVKQFSPGSDAERDALCRMAKVCNPGRVPVTPGGKDISPELATIAPIFNNPDETDVPGALKRAGYRVVNSGGGFFAVNTATHKIVDLGANGFDVSKLAKPQIQQQLRRAANGHRAAEVYGKGDNREWEIRKGMGDHVDGEDGLRR